LANDLCAQAVSASGDQNLFHERVDWADGTAQEHPR
jgi:hypothetical protein